MEKKTYFEKLKDPRWQKKRLEMLESAEFKCQSCGDTEDTLNVHHVFYEKDTDPWDYQDKVYMVLCNKCHEKWHRIKAAMDEVLCQVDIDHLTHLNGIITLLTMMGSNVTLIFYDLIVGYHWRQFEKEEERKDF